MDERQRLSVGEPASVQAPATETTVAVERLTKRYGALVAVAGISFTIGAGEIFALLGPNGAGKTTTVEILEGYRRPDAGSVRVLGLDPSRAGARLKPWIGVVLQEDGVYPGLTARELLRLYADYFADPDDPDGLLDRVGLTTMAKTRCRRLSGGQKRRLALALAFVGRPRVLFLDEPTTGMDPQARITTWDLIRAQRDRGATIVLTTHLMDEAERLADRVAIIDHGKIIALDRPSVLTGGNSAGAIRLVAQPGIDPEALSRLPGAHAARELQTGVYLLETTDAAQLLVELTTWLRDERIPITEVRVGAGSLEEAYLRLTGRELRS